MKGAETVTLGLFSRKRYAAKAQQIPRSMQRNFPHEQDNLASYAKSAWTAVVESKT